MSLSEVELFRARFTTPDDPRQIESLPVDIAEQPAPCKLRIHVYLFDTDGFVDAARAHYAFADSIEIWSAHDTGDVQFDKKNASRARARFQEAWRKSVGKAHWIIRGHTHEFVYHPGLVRFLHKAQGRGVTVIKPAFYEMILESDKLPLVGHNPNGFRNDTTDRVVIFHPISRFANKLGRFDSSLKCLVFRRNPGTPLRKKLTQAVSYNVYTKEGYIHRVHRPRRHRRVTSVAVT